MKKVLTIMVILIGLGMVAGGFYNTVAQLNTIEDAVGDYALLNAFPYEMPDVVTHPAPGYGLFQGL